MKLLGNVLLAALLVAVVTVGHSIANNADPSSTAPCQVDPDCAGAAEAVAGQSIVSDEL